MDSRIWSSLSIMLIIIILSIVFNPLLAISIIDDKQSPSPSSILTKNSSFDNRNHSKLNEKWPSKSSIKPQSSISEKHHHHHHHHHQTLSNYTKAAIWIQRFNSRFQPLLKHCLQSTCQCLADLDNLAKMANVPVIIRPDNHTKQINLTSNQRRRMATILLTNIIRLDRFQQKWTEENLIDDDNQDGMGKQKNQLDSWYECRLSKSICPKDSLPNNHYDQNRQQLLSLLMPDFFAESQRTMNESEKSSLFSFEFVQNLDDLLRRLSRNLISLPPISSSSNVSMKLEKWFGRENIIDDLNRIHLNDTNDSSLIIETMALIIVNRLVKGEKIELFESRFLRDIIDRYGKKYSQSNSIQSSFSKENIAVIDQYGLARLLNDLHIGGLIDQSDHESSIPQHRGHRSVLNNPHNHQVKFLISAMNSIANNNPIGKNLECFNYDFYMGLIKQIQHSTKHENDVQNQSEMNFLTENVLQHLAPIFLQQILSKACERSSFDNHDNIEKRNASHEQHQSESIVKESEHVDKIDKDDDHSIGKAILYGNICVFIISLSSLGGVLLIPILESRAFALTIQMLIGLAFSSMSGDALFHIIPAVLGIHSHDHNDNNSTDLHHHHHDDDDGENHFEFLWLMVAISASIYVLFLFEVISNSLAKLKEKAKKSVHLSNVNDHGQQHYPHHHHHKKHHHDHLHGHFAQSQNNNMKESTSSIQSSCNSSKLSTTEMAITNDKSLSSNNKIEDSANTLSPQILTSSISNTELIVDPSVSSKDIDDNSSKNNIICLGMTSLALIITISDSMHNLLDGVAIGISFSSSITRGLSASIAVFCHELPHEFGDFAVMLSTGMSVKRAAIINFVSALTCFIGFFIGILLGNSDQANRWSLAVCAGLFLYIALCDMLPELKEMADPIFTRQWCLSFLLKNIGIISGYIFMILIALYEDKINFA
ncbi:uncharacterized protein LOC113798516 isoform X2 [Dermatophagoides pteronyssinus]|uniref:uncharacterized protein LOC113798516 isoform X2 n=1 Tax=Dermatophagoides pteronyssinus TaxID=6956 RepID=UPI003F669134